MCPENGAKGTTAGHTQKWKCHLGEAGQVQPGDDLPGEAGVPSRPLPAPGILSSECEEGLSV